MENRHQNDISPLCLDLSKILLDWYAVHGRTLPWRETRDPYRIWISEIILQQTRVAQGTDYYLRFIGCFPDIASLAKASLDDVLKLWQGLGYYSRARNLHASARDISERFGGIFPRNYQDVRSLPGIGDYTAAAICSIAYDTPIAVVDGNVYRLLSRLWDIDLPIDSTEGKRCFAHMAAQLLDKGQPGTYNQALMDFGAIQCTPGLPDCPICPLKNHCQAFKADIVLSRPVKKKKTQVIPRYFHYFHIVHQGHTWLSRREGNDIWQGLYEFPLIETNCATKPEDLQRDTRYRELFDQAKDLHIALEGNMVTHLLSHRSLHIQFYRVEFSQPGSILSALNHVSTDQLLHYPVPRPIQTYLESIPVTRPSDR